ncbi:MAG: arginine--tRNA ligase [Candidatus Micrarchaeia archaeon]
MKEMMDVVCELLYDACVASGYGADQHTIESSIREAKQEFGDVASTLAFIIAKEAGESPKDIADAIVQHISGHKYVEKVESVGGYINFRMSGEFFNSVINSVDENFGRGDEKNTKVIVEFPSVNPNKPWHAGHVRNAVLGDSIARIKEADGYRVERLDYIDDLGLQVAQSFWGYLRSGEKIEGKADLWLGTEYVKVAGQLEDEKLASEVRELMKKMEEGNNEVARKAREVAEMCVRAQRETAEKYGIFHDVLVWESDLVWSGLLKKTLGRIMKTSICVREIEGDNSGCIVAKLGNVEEFGDLQNPDKILVRSDGTATYTGKDLAFHMWKFGLIDVEMRYGVFMSQKNGKPLYTTSREGEVRDFGKADLVVNVIGVEQTHEQKAVAEIMRALGYGKEANGIIHVAYEHVELPQEKFSGRKGTWVGYTADELFEEAVNRAYKEIKERFVLEEEEKKKVAEIVGLAAIRFGMLRVSPEKKIVFRWEDVLNFEGDSAPYIQYMCARARRIIEKAESSGFSVGECKVEADEEKGLARLISKFPDIVQKASRDCRPHYIAMYLLDVATAFSKFYEKVPVLKAGEKERASRLRLVLASYITMRNGLGLLGIEVPEKM